MTSSEARLFSGFSVCLVLIALLAFAILQWLQIPSGSFLDWIIGLASFWWLLAIVTIPWNIHFAAKHALDNATISQAKNIAVDPQSVAYVRQVVGRSRIVAIGLHLVSAIGLYALAAAGISSIGYVSSIATLLFTGLRPAIVFYQYLVNRLSAIDHSFKFPREDVRTVSERLATVMSQLDLTIERVQNLEQELSLDRVNSFASRQAGQIQVLTDELQALSVEQRQQTIAAQADRERLRAEARQAIAQITADGQFLEHVREIIRFVKTS
ncbi:MAG: hypothetical protein HC795_11340 [Coleofasciculaceae cyanobacterium RL_1_1]|nr:hypothetical protein [Coleofasciculaceae cyanobacterium RL_1_1]